MKKIIAIFSFMFIASFAMAQSPVQFATLTHSFGKIAQNKPVTFDFSFNNTSSKAVIVDVATAECGCTTPEYPKAPIAKGKAGVIKVTYNAKGDILSASANDTPVILTIEGEVIAAKSKSADVKKDRHLR